MNFILKKSEKYLQVVKVALDPFNNKIEKMTGNIPDIGSVLKVALY